jgi:hypothetical protein
MNVNGPPTIKVRRAMIGAEKMILIWNGLESDK